jgi:hypothetical protein
MAERQKMPERDGDFQTDRLIVLFILETSEIAAMSEMTDPPKNLTSRKIDAELSKEMRCK